MSLLGLEPEESHVRAAMQNAAGAAASGMDHSEFDEMQRITRSISILKRLRLRGIGSVVWGLIAIGVGANAMQVNPINGILLALGIFLVAEGAWNAFVPTPVGLRVDGVAIGLVGIWGCAATIMNILGGQPNILPGIIGIVLIRLAFRSFSTYDSVSGCVDNKPAAETLRRLDQMTEALRVADVSSDPSIISFTSGNKLYKGQLSEAGAFIGAWDRGISGGDSPIKVRNIIFANKQDISFLNRSLTRPGAELKVTFVVDESSGSGARNRKYYGRMSPDSLQRFAAWRNGVMPTEASTIGTNFSLNIEEKTRQHAQRRRLLFFLSFGALALFIVVAFFAVPSIWSALKHKHERDLIDAFGAHLPGYRGPWHKGNMDERRPRIHGKLLTLLITPSGLEISPLFSKLPDRLRPNSPEEVRTLVQMKCASEIHGFETCYIVIIDKTTGTVIGSDEETGFPAEGNVLFYLTNLPYE